MSPSAGPGPGWTAATLDRQHVSWIRHKGPPAKARASRERPPAWHGRDRADVERERGRGRLDRPGGGCECDVLLLAGEAPDPLAVTAYCPRQGILGHRPRTRRLGRGTL